MPRHRKPQLNRTCKQCGRPFRTARREQRFCQGHCRRKFHDQRKRPRL